MLRIGKADLYFTLWNVRSDKNYSTDINGNHYLSAVYTHYDYIQNLSMTESKAIEKAKGFGVTELTPDEDLRGRRSSWVKTKTFDEPVVENVFTFGKYSGGLFIENVDVSYCKWYYDNNSFVSSDSKETMKNRIVELDPDEYCIYEGELETLDYVEMMKQIEVKNEFIKKNGFIDVFVSKNVDDHHRLFAEGLNFLFETIKENWYQSWAYYLPVFDGKAKRIKNKMVRFYVGVTPNIDGEWNVTKMEIIKK